MFNHCSGKLKKYLIMIISCTFLLQDVDCSINERRLLQDLLRNYDLLERPVNNESDTLLVTLGITYQQIIKLGN
uniref:Neurotransmitter-gated ion-channel ligand-binding domain-containing protein n=1 Tax=Tetranychus urticae TaxID=32264 RepID=A0A158P5F9_TETUR